jgi:hypothetical protein
MKLVNLTELFSDQGNYFLEIFIFTTGSGDLAKNYVHTCVRWSLITPSPIPGKVLIRS